MWCVSFENLSVKHTEWGLAFERAAGLVSISDLESAIDKSVLQFVFDSTNTFDPDFRTNLNNFCDALLPRDTVQLIGIQMSRKYPDESELFSMFMAKYELPAMELNQLFDYESDQASGTWCSEVPDLATDFSINMFRLRVQLSQMFDLKDPEGIWKKIKNRDGFNSKNITCSGRRIVAVALRQGKRWIDDDRRWQLVERFFNGKPIIENLNPDVKVDFKHLSELEGVLSTITQMAGEQKSQRDIAGILTNDKDRQNSVARRVITRLTDFAVNDMRSTEIGTNMISEIESQLQTEGLQTDGLQFYQRVMAKWNDFNQTADLFPVRAIKLLSEPLQSAEWKSRTSVDLLTNPEYKMAGYTVAEISDLLTSGLKGN